MEHILLSAPQQPTNGLVVIFHGHGGNAEEFTNFAGDIQRAIPTVDCICLKGPETVEDGQGKKYSTWLQLNSLASLPKISLQLLFNRVPTIHKVNAFIDQELADRNLMPDRLGLFGFSLGGGIALTIGMSRPQKCGGIVSHSGVYYRYPHIKSRPDTLVIMGDQDYLYSDVAATGLRGAFQRTFGYQHMQSIDRLRQTGLTLEEEIVSGLQHGMNTQSLNSSIDFLKRKLLG